MAAYEAAHPPRKIRGQDGEEVTLLPPPALALDLATGETSSGSSGDYFMLGPHEPLQNADHEPLVLVVCKTTVEYRDALTDVTLLEESA